MNRGRGRPAGLGSRVLDITAVALDLPPWDAQERQMIRRVARRIKHIQQAKDGDPWLQSQLEQVLRDLRAWWKGDEVENVNHDQLVVRLREVNEALDSAKAA